MDFFFHLCPILDLCLHCYSPHVSSSTTGPLYIHVTGFLASDSGTSPTCWVFTNMDILLFNFAEENLARLLLRKHPTFQQSLVNKDASLKCSTSTTDNTETSLAFFSRCCNPAKAAGLQRFGWWKLSHPESTSSRDDSRKQLLLAAKRKTKKKTRGGSCQRD